MSALDAFIVALGRHRTDALRTRRRQEQARRLGGERRLGIAEIAERLGGLCAETVRRRMARGDITGAYLERGRWQLREVDLWSYDPRTLSDEEGMR